MPAVVLASAPAMVPVYALCCGVCACARAHCSCASCFVYACVCVEWVACTHARVCLCACVHVWAFACVRVNTCALVGVHVFCCTHDVEAGAGGVDDYGPGHARERTLVARVCTNLCVCVCVCVCVCGERTLVARVRTNLYDLPGRRVDDPAPDTRAGVVVNDKHAVGDLGMRYGV